MQALVRDMTLAHVHTADAPKSFQDFRKKRARDVEDQPGSTPHPAKKTRPVEESRLGRTTAAATSPPPTDTAQRILDTLSKMVRNICLH